MNKKEKAAITIAFRTFWHRESVVGIDLGYRIKKHKHTTEKCIRFHVREKRPRSKLSKSECFPKSVGGVNTDVISACYYKRNGIGSGSEFGSIGDSNASFGTLGALVRDVQNGKLAGLTCAHVLEASIESRGTRKVLQPAPCLTPSNTSEIGSLGRYLWSNDMDAALIALQDGIAPTSPIPANISISSISDSVIGMRLEKYGASTGRTLARVEGIGRYEVDYGDRLLSFNAFRLLPLLNQHSQIAFAGDSGSIWMDPNTHSAVGLNFAGEDTPFPEDEYALALPMSRVANALSFSF
jgi:hypothetical protein